MWKSREWDIVVEAALLLPPHTIGIMITMNLSVMVYGSVCHAEEVPL